MYYISAAVYHVTPRGVLWTKCEGDHLHVEANSVDEALRAMRHVRELTEGMTRVMVVMTDAPMDWTLAEDL